MNDNLSQFSNDQFIDATQTNTKSFVANVFSYMALALVISGATAYIVASSGLIKYLINANGISILGWIVMLAPLGLVIAMGAGFNRFSYRVLTALFLLYAALFGLSLSSIFLVYKLSSIGSIFFITAGLFAIMAAVGYTTKTDLTKFGSILMMALIGVILASLVNYFLESSGFQYILSCVSVLIFVGLTAYDTQKIKRIGAGVEYGTAEAGKLAVMGALSLYLDFVNLFLLLLRLFGDRRD